MSAPELINDIVTELTDHQKPLVSALLKTKVLAKRLENKKLADWASNELNGYPGRTPNVVPTYRHFSGTIIGDYINGMHQVSGMPIDLSFIDDDLRTSFQKIILSESIETIEELKKNSSPGKNLGITLPSELQYSFQDWLRVRNPSLSILSLKQQFSSSCLTEVLSAVRSSLLDFMLDIEAELGHITEFKELKSKNEVITQYFYQTIMNDNTITTNGDGNVINTGNKAKIDVSITVTKGNKEALREKLASNNVPESDISELLTIIDTESPNRENGTFGTNVNTWMKKMIGKAVDGSWQIGVGAAGGLLVEAVKAYLGMG